MADRYKFNKFERSLLDIASVNHDYIQNLSQFNNHPYYASHLIRTSENKEITHDNVPP